MTAPRDLPSETASSARQVRQLQKYALGEQVAQGGMGAVLRAQDLNIERTVAMKVVLAGMKGSPALIQRFAQEARITGQLEHPSIVPVYSLGTDEQGRPFYTMKFVQGVTLHEVIEKIKAGDAEAVAKYPLTHLLTIFQKVCDAVAFAHSKGVIHRDLKPANIMIGEYGEVLVMDWGLAKLMRMDDRGSRIADSESSPSSILHSPSSDLTLAGQIMGTPQFMAPEQAEGKVDEIDARSDIFSLGAILYNLLTLRPPVNGGSVAEVLQKVRTGNIPAPTSYNPKSSGKRKFSAASAVREARNSHEFRYEQPVSGSPRPVVVRIPLRHCPGGRILERYAGPHQLSLRIPLRHCPGGRIPESLSAVCMKALALQPADRYQSVKELQKDIEAYHGGFATLAEKAGTFKLIWLLIKRHKTLFLVSHAALLIVVIVSVAFSIRNAATLHRLRATAPASYAQAQLLIQQLKFEMALEKITTALVLMPEEANYHCLRGHILEALLRLDDARQAYTEALRLNPQQALAAENLKLCESILADNEGEDELPVGSLTELHAAMLKQGRQSEAAVILQKLGTDHQQHFEAAQRALEKTSWWAEAQKSKSLKFQLKSDGTFDLEVYRILIDDLAVLKGMPLSELRMNRVKSGDLSPLRGMPLRSLVVSVSDNADLSPLKGLPLIFLDLQCDKGCDLSPLKGLPLEKLQLQGLGITDLSWIRGMPITALNIDDAAVTDLTPLHGSRVSNLRLANVPVADLRPLQGLPLRNLTIDGTKVTDLSPLQGMPLRVLNVSNTKVTDLGPLRGMPLQRLGLSQCESLHDLRPLADCKELEVLMIPEQCQDIEFLRQLPKLKQLGYTGSRG